MTSIPNDGLSTTERNALVLRYRQAADFARLIANETDRRLVGGSIEHDDVKRHGENLAQLVVQLPESDVRVRADGLAQAAINGRLAGIGRFAELVERLLSYPANNAGRLPESVPDLSPVLDTAESVQADREPDALAALAEAAEQGVTP